MKPFHWFIIALAVLGAAGLAYWLLRPASASAKKGTGAVGLAAALSTLHGSLANSFSALREGAGNTSVDGSDQGSGNYTANPNWTVSDYGAESGTDYQGNPFVRSSAPVIPFEAKVRPYRHGVDYSFAEQTARGVALFKRFPEFSLTDAKIHMMGPWYSDAGANAHFTHGIETMTALPYFRQGPQTISNLPATRKNSMLGDDLFWQFADILANSVGPGDPIYSALRLLVDNHELSLDQDAYVALGRMAWQSERNATDSQGQGTRYLSLDIEVSAPYTFYRNIVGYLYQGYCGAAAQDGVIVKPFTYYGPEQVTIIGISDRQFGTGEPDYLSNEWDFMANVDPTVSAVCQFGGIFANDTYMQGVWGNEPVYQRNGDGSIVIDGVGSPMFSDLSSTVVYGQTIPLEPGEAEKCLRDLYEQSTRLYLMNHRVAGEYPSRSGMRRGGFEDVSIGSFTRYTNEGVDGVTINDRPVPAWQLELFNAMNLFLTSHLWCWGVDFNHEPDALGTDHSSTWPYEAYGVAETIVKAAHRHSAFGSIQNSAFKWCWFNLAIVNHFLTDGDGYHQKALAHAKIRDVNGTVWLEVFLAFPATDNRPTLFQLWVQKDGLQSIAYECELQSGRHYFYDAWPLPQSFSYDQLEGENVYLTYPDVLNVQRTHRGDYRADVGNVSPPSTN